MNNFTRLRRRLCPISIWALFFVQFCQSAYSRKPEDDWFIIKKISSRIYVASQRKSVRVDATSTIIVGESFLTVVSAQSNEHSSENLIRQIQKEISVKPVRYLVLTHAHLDNSLGANAYKKAYPGLSIIAHVSVSERMRQLANDVNGHIRHIGDILEAIDSTDRRQFNDLKIFQNDIASSKIVLPDLLISDSLELFDGELLNIKIWHLGHGHSPGDLIVLIPKEKVIVTGDLVHEMDPYLGESDPEQWSEILRKIDALDFDWLVGGRGAAISDRAVLRFYIKYIEQLTKFTKEGVALQKTREEVVNSLTSASFKALSEDHSGERIQAVRMRYYENIWIYTLDDLVKNHLEQVWDRYMLVHAH